METFKLTETEIKEALAFYIRNTKMQQDNLVHTTEVTLTTESKIGFRAQVAINAEITVD